MRIPRWHWCRLFYTIPMVRLSFPLRLVALAGYLLCAASCGNVNTEARVPESHHLKPGSYGYDRSFLRKKVDLIELTSGNSKVLLVPQYQGRVMTSTCSGDSGLSFGWINYKLVQSGEVKPHMNAYGGEERLWLGPEGGQFALFFRHDVPYSYDHWFTPKELDTAAFVVTAQTRRSVRFSKRFDLVNRAGTRFSVGIDRKVHILSDEEISTRLPGHSNSLRVVAFESENTLTNRGSNTWQRDSGLLSVWMLGMMKPSPSTTIAIPVKPGNEPAQGPLVNDHYFGTIPPERLKKTATAIFLKADGRQRGKLGVSPLRVRAFIGSYDAASHVLTLLQSGLPSPGDAYVNSAWEDQQHPYAGDAANAYNDGPLEDGSQMGPFYELESSSPAAALAPGQSLTHSQVTYHISGDEKMLDAVSRATLGIGINEIRQAFK